MWGLEIKRLTNTLFADTETEEEARELADALDAVGYEVTVWDLDKHDKLNVLSWQELLNTSASRRVE
jgi:hypothetical protein